MKITASFRFLTLAVLILTVVLTSCFAGVEKSTTEPKDDVTTETPTSLPTEAPIDEPTEDGEEASSEISEGA